MTRTDEEVLTPLRQMFAAHFGGTSETPSVREQDTATFVLASAPGRVELAGNHTDHQGGRTLSAALDRRMYALGTLNNTDEIRLYMDGFGSARLHVRDLAPRTNEQGTSMALVRGMAAAFVRAGGTLRGFDAVTCSDIPAGCGISSSAAFEMLLGVLVNALCSPNASAPSNLTALALDGSWAEDVYFGKPTGAQDQLASVYGGIVSLNFADTVPRVSPVSFDMATSGYSAFLVDSHCDHSQHTAEFVSIPTDMYTVAHYFGQKRLEDVSYQAFLDNLIAVRAALGDRATLRALHYFAETQRVTEQEQALRAGAFERFLELVRLSGASSAQFLQNVSPHADGAGAEQSAMVILSLCANLLGRGGAYRIHGGGFGGSVLTFVPNEQAASFTSTMNRLLGYNACMPATISRQGACATRIAR